MPPLFERRARRARPACTCTGRCPTRCCAARSTEQPDGTANRLGLPLLPDRWVVLRILLPNGPQQAVRARLGARGRPRRRRAARPSGREGSQASNAGHAGRRRRSRADELTGTVGGSAVWAGVYDAVLNRFAFHDPLDDLADGRAERRATATPPPTSSPAGGRTRRAIRSTRPAAPTASPSCSTALRWRLLPDWGDARWRSASTEQVARAQRRPARPRRPRTASATQPSRSGRGARRRARPPRRRSRRSTTCSPQETLASVASTFVAATPFERFVTTPWHLRVEPAARRRLRRARVGDAAASTGARTDRRCGVALGQHDDDVLAALAVGPGHAGRSARATPSGCSTRSPRRRSTASAQPDGVVEIEEHEHAPGVHLAPRRHGRHRPLRLRRAGARARSSAEPARSRRPDRRSTTGAPAQPRGPGACQASRSRRGLVEIATHREARPRRRRERRLRGPRGMRDRPIDPCRPAEPRVVDRPAPRFTFPDRPDGRHAGRAAAACATANDGRASPDGKLTCRWPTQVITEVQGVVGGPHADLLARQRGDPGRGAVRSPARRCSTTRTTPRWLAAAVGRVGAETPTP